MITQITKKQLITSQELKRYRGIFCGPAILLSGTCPTKIYRYVHQKTCIKTRAFIVFIITPKLKPPECPLTAEWMNKLSYDHTMEYYKAKRINDQKLPIISWGNLTDIMLNKRNQTQKNTYCVMHSFKV